MKIDIVVVTQDVDLRDAVGTRKESLLDQSLLRSLQDKGASPVVGAFCDVCVDAENVSQFISRRYSESRACILVVDSRLRNKNICLAPAVLSVELLLPHHNPNYPNALRKSLNFAVKVADRLLPFFESREKLRFALLPRANFAATEWAVFLNSLSGGVARLEFVTVLEKTLALLRERQKPKTSTNHRATFIVSDNGWHFAFGHEEHARAETAHPPHNISCILRSQYRFGFPIKPTQHYNVSIEGGQISGSFVNCHGQVDLIAARSHLNLFPNDYFEK
ncbi:MAG: hypothetical protein ACE368_19185 [Paracoccaceae bacterium]